MLQTTTAAGVLRSNKEVISVMLVYSSEPSTVRSCYLSDILGHLECRLGACLETFCRVQDAPGWSSGCV